MQTDARNQMLEILPNSKTRVPMCYSKATGHGGRDDTVRSGGSTQKDSSQFLATSAIYDQINSPGVGDGIFSSEIDQTPMAKKAHNKWLHQPS